jgi:chromosome segregation ATPase
LEGEVREVQENLRLSAQQNQKIIKELNEHKERISNNDQENEALKKKMQKLLQENSGLAEEVRNAQENVRLSNAQQSKAFQELNEYKRRIEQNDAENEATRRKIQGLVQENQSLGDEVRNAQENLRLSANQISKMGSEINEYKSRFAANNQECETYKLKIQKLMTENNSIS